MGWAGIQNGALLRLAEERFEVFLTIDVNLRYQQNTATLRMGVLILQAPSNRLADLLPIVPAILEALPRCAPGTVTRVAR